MANKPLQSIKFPDLPDTYTIPVVDSTLAVSGAAADAKKTGDELSKKVDAVPGKGLSTEDYSSVEKEKLEGIEAEANKTTIDTTLTRTGQAADAKTVGDAIANEDKKALAAFATDTASGPIAHFEDGADNIPMKDVLVHIEPVQAGSGDPSPTNVRAISGWTAAKVMRCGKNLAEPAFESATKDGITAVRQSDGSYVFNGTATRETNFFLGSTDGNTVTIPIPRNTPLVISGCPDGGGGSTWRLVAWYYNGGTYLNRSTQDVGSGGTINDAEADGIRFAMQIKNGATCENLVFKSMLRLASDTDSTYEPYSGNIYSITFPTEAGTVYGGTLDVATGTLTVTHKLYTFDGSENWTAGNYGLRYEFNLTGLPDYIKTWASGGRGLSNLGIYDSTSYNTPDKNYITSRTNVGASAIGVKNHVLVVPSSVATTVEELKAFLANTPEQWYAPLQTPQTYQLTPQEITSLLGENNLWADTGDSDVEYRADTKMYVDAKVAAAVSALS